MIPFGIAGLSFVLWVLIRFGVTTIKANSDQCWGEFYDMQRPRWAPGRDIFRTELSYNTGSVPRQIVGEKEDYYDAYDISKEETSTNEEITDWWKLPVNASGLQGLALNSASTMLYAFYDFKARVFVLDKDSGSILGLDRSQTYDDAALGMILEKNISSITNTEWVHTKKYGEEIWLVCQGGENQEETGLFAVDADNLNALPSRRAAVRTSIDTQQLAWLAYDSLSQRLYYGEMLNLTVVHWVDILALDEEKGELLLQFNVTDPFRTNGLQYIRGATVDPRRNVLLLIADDASNTLSEVSLETGQILRHQALLAGNEVNGLAFNVVRETLLAGYNRKHSHEQETHVSVNEYYLIP